MRTLLLSLLTFTFFSSCNTYQYLTLDAEKATKNEAKELIWENDTVRLSFNFNGKWGALRLTVFNKTQEPISVNWQKSAIVYKDSSYSLFSSTARLDGDIQRNLVDFRPPEINIERLAEVKGTITMPGSFSFLPPQTHITQQNLQLSRVLPVISALPDLPVQKMKGDGMDVKYRKAIYDSATSPFRFKLFLTYDAANGQQFFTQHVFYATEIKQTNESGPYQVLINDDGDKFYCILRTE